MRRRKVLVLGGIAFTTTLAGCGGETDTNDGNGVDPTPEPTPEPDDGDADNNADTDTDRVEEEPDNDPAPDPVVENFSGTGSDVIDGLTSSLAGPWVFDMTHTGESNFQVELLDEDGELVDLLVNEIGSYEGSNMPQRDLVGGYTIDIEADGGWTVNVTYFPEYRPGDDELETEFPQTVDGETDAVFGPFSAATGRTLTWDVEGDSNNQITAIDAFGDVADLPLNEIGPDSGSGVISTFGDVMWLDVVMSGPFEMEIE